MFWYDLFWTGFGIKSVRKRIEDHNKNLHKVDDLVDDFTGMLRVRSYRGSRLGCHFTRGQILINSVGKRIYLQIP